MHTLGEGLLVERVRSFSSSSLSAWHYDASVVFLPVRHYFELRQEQVPYIISQGFFRSLASIGLCARRAVSMPRFSAFRVEKGASGII